MAEEYYVFRKSDIDRVAKNSGSFVRPTFNGQYVEQYLVGILKEEDLRAIQDKITKQKKLREYDFL